jgi:hypothetical protein
MLYHPSFKPAPFTDLTLYNSMIGHAVQEWNSPSGVSSDVWFYIVVSNILCYGCERMYSIDGLEAHAPAGLCDSGVRSVSADYCMHFKISSLPVCDCFFLLLHIHMTESFVVDAKAPAWNQLSAATRTHGIPSNIQATDII